MACEPEESMGFDHPAAPGSATSVMHAFSKILLRRRIGHALGKFETMCGHDGGRGRARMISRGLCTNAPASASFCFVPREDLLKRSYARGSSPSQQISPQRA
jgi:hypothetical protein